LDSSYVRLVVSQKKLCSSSWTILIPKSKKQCHTWAGQIMQPPALILL